MLLSFFWGCQVIVNVAHVTTSGTIASWWFGGRGAGPAVGVGSDARKRAPPPPLAKSTIGLTGGHVDVDMDGSGGFVPPNPILEAADSAEGNDLEKGRGAGSDGAPRPSSLGAAAAAPPMYAPLPSLTGIGGRTGEYPKASGRRVAVRAALRQALTTSFGSICVGSFVVAVLQTARALMAGLREKLRQNHYDNDGYGASPTVAALAAEGGATVGRRGTYHPHVETCVRGILCFADWAIVRLERIMEYFNKVSSFLCCEVARVRNERSLTS